MPNSIFDFYATTLIGSHMSLTVGLIIFKWFVLLHPYLLQNIVLFVFLLIIFGYISGGTASYLLGMSGRIAAQADEASNPINVKNLSLGWMIGFLFLVSFVGLFSIVPLRKV